MTSHFLNITFNKLFYKYFYCLYLCGKNKSFVLETESILHFFHLIWGGVWCYSIKGSVFLLRFLWCCRELEIHQQQQIQLFGYSKESSSLRNVHQYIFLTICDTLRSKSSKHTICNIGYVDVVDYVDHVMFLCAWEIRWEKNNLK